MRQDSTPLHVIIRHERQFACQYWTGYFRLKPRHLPSAKATSGAARLVTGIWREGVVSLGILSALQPAGSEGGGRVRVGRGGRGLRMNAWNAWWIPAPCSGQAGKSAWTNCLHGPSAWTSRPNRPKVHMYLPFIWTRILHGPDFCMDQTSPCTHGPSGWTERSHVLTVHMDQPSAWTNSLHGPTVCWTNIRTVEGLSVRNLVCDSDPTLMDLG